MRSLNYWIGRYFKLFSIDLTVILSVKERGFIFGWIYLCIQFLFYLFFGTLKGGYKFI